MALINFFQQTFAKICPKFHHQSLCFSSKTTKSNDCCTDLQKVTRQEEDEYLPEPVIKDFLNQEEIQRRQILRKCKIVLRAPEDISLVSGVALDIPCTRHARIHQPTKNAQQQGTRHLGHWEIDFDTKERWENPLMGWCSSGDPISNTKISFSTREQAIAYCKKNRIGFWVQDDKRCKKFKVRSYANNFHFKNRTRVSTK